MQNNDNVSGKKIQLADIDLNLLVALHALLETGSVTRAAAETGVTQSAMSHSLRRLRAMFGDKLLIRAHGGMSLTPRAESLREPLFRSLLALQQTVRSSQNFVPETSTRSFTIAATDLMQLLFLPVLAGVVSNEAPGVTIQVESAVRNPPIYALLESGDIDVLIGSVLLREFPGIKRKLLRKVRMVCAVRREHPLISGSLTLDQYTALPHLLISPGGSGPGLVDTYLSELQRTRRIAMRVSSFLIAPWVLAKSDYVLTAPEPIISAHQDLLGLEILQPPIELSHIPLHLLWHERSHRDPGTRWLRDTLVRVFQSGSPSSV